MSKHSKERPQRAGDERPLIPPRYQHAVALAILVLSIVVFFREPIFQGKIFLSSDNIASHSFDTFLKDAAQQDVFPLWNPYIFCGMPGYGSLSVSGDRSFDLSYAVFGFVSKMAGYILMNPSVGWVIFYYMIFACGMYLLAWSKLQTKVAASIVALGAVFSVFIIIWVMVGHNTKIAVIAMFPFILFTVERLRDRFQWPLALLLVLLLHFSFVPSHVQMIFYTYLAIGIYLAFFLIRALATKTDWKSPLRTGLVLAAATALAFSMDADKYLSVLEYNPHSIRGSGPITESVGDGAKSAEGGLDYGYATSWSWGVGEAFTVFIPSLYGYGNVEYRGPLTNNQPQKLPLYFGPQPWTDAPQYMGIVILLLAWIGFWRNRRDPFIQYLALLIAFSVLVAFGKEFPLVYDLMYNYVPMFNKFRVPSMILVLVQIMVPLLAGYGMVSFLDDRKEPLNPKQEKQWKVILASLAGLFVLSLVARGVFTGLYGMFFSPQDVAEPFVQRGFPRRIIGEVHQYIAGMVASDLTAAFGVLLLAFGAIYLWLRRSIKITALACAVGLAVLIDLWRVNTGPMEPHEKSTQQSTFAAPDYVTAILQQEGMDRGGTPQAPFRVLEFQNGSPPFSNMLAYWRLQSAYGYQGAKMRRYQDLVDVAGLQNPLVWQLMNVRYIITDRPDSSQWLALFYDGPERKVYYNRLALPRAYFVNRYEVADGLALLQKMAALAFNPADVAFLAEDPGISIDPPTRDAEVGFSEYGILGFTLDVKATGNNLLILSESYYPEGWKAFLDGKEIPIHRANYHFRALVIPEGAHTVSMKFEPSGFYLGKNLSLGANVVVILGFGYLAWGYWRRNKGFRPKEEHARDKI